jgi:serine protease Do
VFACQAAFAVPAVVPRFWRLAAPRLFAICCAAAVIAVPAAAQTRALPDSFGDLAQTLGPSVVNISTTQAPTDKGDKDSADSPELPPGSPFDQFGDTFGNRGRQGTQHPQVHSLGSGFVIAAAGLIVTNNHVIAGAEEINVILPDDTRLKAQVVGRDTVTDLALLKVEPKQPLTEIKWGDSNKARVGDWVLAVEVIGINSAIYSPTGGSIGIGFAIPSSLAQPVIEQLMKNGKVERGWIGVRIQAVTDEIADTLGLDKARGALVTDVDQNSPAARAKLLPGDVILSFDGKPIEKTRQLPRLVAETPADKSVSVGLWRDGKEAAVDVKVGALNAEKLAVAPPPSDNPQKETPTIDAVGMSLAKVTPDLRRDMELTDDVKGVIVIDVDEDGAAAKQGVQPGDVVAAVGRDAVTAPEQVVEKVEAARKAGRKSILLRIERDGSGQFFALPIDKGNGG